MWGSAAALQAQQTPTELQLSDRLGFGTGWIADQNYTDSALSVRYWLSEKCCLDLFFNYSGFSQPGDDFTGKPLLDPQQTIGTGLGLKVNVKQPVKNLFIQLIGQATYCDQNYRDSNTDEVSTYDYQTFGGFAGIGFEYFIPFFDSLSVEANIGYSGTIETSTTGTSYNPVYYPGKQNQTIVQTYPGGHVQVNGMSLSTLNIHFYL